MDLECLSLDILKADLQAYSHPKTAQLLSPGPALPLTTNINVLNPLIFIYLFFFLADPGLHCCTAFSPVVHRHFLCGFPVADHGLWGSQAPAVAAHELSSCGS